MTDGEGEDPEKEEAAGGYSGGSERIPFAAGGWVHERGGLPGEGFAAVFGGDFRAGEQNGGRGAAVGGEGEGGCALTFWCTNFFVH